MKSLRWLQRCMCVIALAFGCLAIAEPVYAQSAGFDRDMATREGVGGSLGTKEFDQQQLPGKFKIGLGVGSIFVAVAVVKWL